jgi:transketolase
MATPSVVELERKAADLRTRILEAALAAGKGHVPPAFSWVEIGVALFHGGILRFRPDDPTWAGRDRFILSKGHGCLTLYAILADLGVLPSDELTRFVADGGRLAGHPDPAIPGVEAVSGSLGHGLGLAAGLALGLRADDADWAVVTVLGDGECQEGSIWEAAAFASQHGLGRLTAIVDRNRLGATDYTERSLGLEPFADRWAALGWDVRRADGHSIPAILAACGDIHCDATEAPRVVIAETVKGKGVGFMEASPAWHHRMPKGAEIATARAELAARLEARP